MSRKIAHNAQIPCFLMRLSLGFKALSQVIMTSEVQYFTSQQAASILGVNVSTVKRWTDEGKLQCIASAGGHRRFLLRHLSEFLQAHSTKTSKINVFPIDSELDLQIAHRILKRDYEFLIDHVLTQAFQSRRDLIQHVLNGLFLAQVQLHEIYDHLITPVFRHIGTQWAEGAISVSEEHLASQSVKDAVIRLQGILRSPSEKQGTVLCLNLSGELHDIALKMVDHILEARGFQVVYTGQITPIVDVDQVFEHFRPQRLYISSTVVTDQSQAELDRCAELCATHQCLMFVGGAGFETLKVPASAKRLYTFSDVAAS